jgi:hypothetical protein
MSMKPSNLRLTHAGRDPARAELATAIEEATAAERIAEAARSAVALAREMVDTAEARLSTALDDVVQARSAHANRLVAAAQSGKAAAPDTALRAARAHEAEARDDADAAKEALATVEAALTDPEAELQRAQKRVATLVKPIMAPATEQLMAEIAQLQEQAGARRAALSFLLSECFPWPPSDESRRLEAFLSAPIYPFDYKAHPALVPWRQAQEALTRDADAALPVAAHPGLKAVT